MQIQDSKIILPRPGLLVLAGCSGSGKSTLAGVHFPEDWVVSSDRCRWMICGDESNQSVTRQAFELLDCLVAARLLHGQTTVVDSTALQPRDRAGLVAKAKQQGMPVWMLMVWASQQQCLEAQTSRQRQVPEAAVQRMFARAQGTRQAILSAEILTEGFDRAILVDRYLQVLAQA